MRGSKCTAPRNMVAGRCEKLLTNLRTFFQPVGVHLVLVSDGQHEIVVVQVAGDLRTDRLWIERRRRCGRCRGIAAPSTSASATTTRTAALANTKTHLHDCYRMSGLRVHAGIRRTDVHI